MTQKAYLVLSVSEINRLAKYAKANARANGKHGCAAGRHTVVLYPTIDSSPELLGTEGEAQICGMTSAIGSVKDSTELTLRAKAPLPVYR